MALRRSSKGAKHRERGRELLSSLQSQVTFASIDIARLLNDVYDVELVQQNNPQELLGLCPWHDEKTPSFRVHRGKSICKCFGCGQSRTLYQILQDISGKEYIRAQEYLDLYAKYGLTADGTASVVAKNGKLSRG